MEFKLFIVFLLALSIKAQMVTDTVIPIPCINDDSCKSFLRQDEGVACANGTCMCLNAANWEICSNQDMIVGDKPKVLDRSCNSDEDCERLIPGTTCQSIPDHYSGAKSCICSEHKVLSANGSACLDIAHEPSSSCTEDVQCRAKLEGAECVRGRCHCQNNFHYADQHGKCVFNKGYGAPCTKEEQSCYQSNPDGKNVMGCSNKNVCKCIRHYSYIDGHCQRSGAPKTTIQLFLLAILVIATLHIC